MFIHHRGICPHVKDLPSCSSTQNAFLRPQVLSAHTFPFCVANVYVLPQKVTSRNWRALLCPWERNSDLQKVDVASPVVVIISIPACSAGACSSPTGPWPVRLQRRHRRPLHLEVASRPCACHATALPQREFTFLVVFKSDPQLRQN